MTKITINNVIFKNPCLPASGTYSFGIEFIKFYDVNQTLGALVTKSITLNKVDGHKQSRVSSFRQTMINAIGLENPGISGYHGWLTASIKHNFKNLPLVVNIYGFSISEYVELATKIDEKKSADIIEINVSCPNVKQFQSYINDANKLITTIIRSVKKVTSIPIWIKLSVGFSNIVSLAKECENAGADGIVLINSIPGIKIDLASKKPALSNIYGGISGPGIKPIALRAVYDVYQHVNIPIIGVGGIESAYDVIEFMLAGASLVEIGTANFRNPFAIKQIVNDLPKVMNEFNIKSLTEIIGVANSKNH